MGMPAPGGRPTADDGEAPDVCASVTWPPTHTPAARTCSDRRTVSSEDARDWVLAGTATRAVAGTGYLPCHLGARFSAKATAPSMASAEVNTSVKVLSLSAHASVSDKSALSSITRFE